MLKNYCVHISLWGGDKIVKEIVKANNPSKACQRARESVQKRTKVPFDMIDIKTVEIIREQCV